MKFLKTHGIVLKEIDTGDADKLIIVLTPDHGKITVAAPGAKRARSKFVGCSELLCYSQMELFKTRDNYRLNEGHIVEPFYQIRSDVVKLTYATYFSEVLMDVVMEEYAAKKELRLFLNCLHYINKDLKILELVASIFELRLLSINGMSPFVGGCISCYDKDAQSYSFSFKECGLLCNKCLSRDINATSILSGTYSALKHIINSKFDSLFRFDVSKDVQTELRFISKRFFRERIEKRYKSLDFLEKL
jgi:DNA repair protein RecO (recombination protein O)